MTDERMDPRFEAAVRAALTELEPGEVPPTLRDAVVAVPRRASRPRGGLRLLAGLGAVAAAVVVAVALVGLVDRLAAPSIPVAASPSEAIGVPAPARRLDLALAPVDPAADLEAIAGVLRVRLSEAGFDDATITVEDGRFHAEVVVAESEIARLASARRLLTSVGLVEAFGLGPDVVAQGDVVDVDGLPLLFEGEDITEAVVDEAGGTLAITLDADGTQRFGEYTATHVGDYVAITVDGVALSVPSVNEPIIDGDVQISAPGDGGAWLDQARELVAVLASGPLPSGVTVLDEQASASPAPSPVDPGPTAGAPASGEPAPTATATPVDTSSLRYICDQFPFAAAVLEEQRFDELADRPEAAALRAHLAAQPAADELLPREGWTLVGANSGAAEYVARRGDGTFANVFLRHRVSWEVIGFGGCSPVLRLADGSGAGTWVVAPGQAIGPETTTFDALVTERACASGKSADGRIVGPTAFYGDEVVVVVFGVRPLPTGQDCPSNPSTRVTVTLDEPLGDRRLLDGSVLPHREPEPEF